MNLFPKDKIFYNLFERQAEKLEEASEILDKILKNPSNLEEYALKMKKVEEEGDDVGHQVVDYLRRSFITPLEEGDIDLLRQKLDDILDAIEVSVNRLLIYKISVPFPGKIEEYFIIIQKAIKEIGKGIKDIRSVSRYQENLHQRCERLNELENEGDIINRMALKELMDSPSVTAEKILEVVKLKEIYDSLEEAIDCCEDVGNIFESILIKNR